MVLCCVSDFVVLTRSNCKNIWEIIVSMAQRNSWLPLCWARGALDDSQNSKWQATIYSYMRKTGAFSQHLHTIARIQMDYVRFGSSVSYNRHNPNINSMRAIRVAMAICHRYIIRTHTNLLSIVCGIMETFQAQNGLYAVFACSAIVFANT